MKRGQITIEYIIVIVVVMLLFSGISLDLISDSQKDAREIGRKLQERSVSSLLKSYGEMMSLQGSGGKKVLFLRAPPSCVISVEPAQLREVCEPTEPPFQYMNPSVPAGTVITTSFPGVAYSCVSCSRGEVTSYYACAQCNEQGAKDYGTPCSQQAFCFKAVSASSSSLITPSGGLIEVKKS
ncbi:hypothetical protein HYS54_05030 [Candidatus Micrarchaeota archaeon]|nr:hypothetical protein [Candidatus Micrarchaeota archaeon]